MLLSDSAEKSSKHQIFIFGHVKLQFWGHVCIVAEDFGNTMGQKFGKSPKSTEKKSEPKLLLLLETEQFSLLSTLPHYWVIYSYLICGSFVTSKEFDSC